MVARHIVMAGMLIDEDPEGAYEHAQAAVRRAGRIDVAREAAGLTAYATSRYAEALRELRTVRRLNGSLEYVAVMADCERGLGRPERAIELAEDVDQRKLSTEVRVELAIVVSGARLDMAEPEAALAALSNIPALDPRDHRESIGRLASARGQVLQALGRDQEAQSAHAHAARLAPDSVTDPEDDVFVFDLEDGDLEDGDLEDGDLEDGDLEDGDLEDGDLEDGEVQNEASEQDDLRGADSRSELIGEPDLAGVDALDRLDGLNSLDALDGVGDQDSARESFETPPSTGALASSCENSQLVDSAHGAFERAETLTVEAPDADLDASDDSGDENVTGDELADPEERSENSGA